MKTNLTGRKPIILVDGSSYLFRAYYALPPLMTTQGQPTGAIYGVVNMLRKLVSDYEPTHFAVIFDPKGKSFRHTLYPQYKANRSTMPQDLQLQIKPLFEVIEAMGFPLVIENGYEADDVIATFTEMAKREKWPVIISTGDKDLAQLVEEDVTLINTMTNTRLDIPGVKTKFGILPTQMIDYLTLVGDTSDNLPGVAQVGPKTAVKWLSTYGSIEGLVQNAQALSGKAGENFRACIPALPAMQELVRVRTQVPISQTLADLKRRSPDPDKLSTLFTTLEFKSWALDLNKEQGLKTHRVPIYRTILKLNELTNFLKKYETKLIAFDTETTDLDPIKARLVGISLAGAADEGIYIPLRHDYAGVPQQLPVLKILEELKFILEDPNRTILFHNLKYDALVLLKEGIQITARTYDTLIESYLLNSTGPHELGALSLRHLGRKAIKFEDVAGRGAKQITFNQVGLEEATAYSAQDADLTFQLHQHFFSQIKKDLNSKKILETIDIPLVFVLVRMENRGVLIDSNQLTQQSKILEKALLDLKTETFLLAKEEFNLDSPKQLQKVLYQQLKLPVLEKTPGGQPSTAESTLQLLSEKFPIANILLQYRRLSKLKSTYTDRLPQQVNQETGRVHTSYNQTVTSTGRLSSNNPNLQNIPIRTLEGRRIRRAFIAPPGYKLVAADYSQVELRIMAHISKEPKLIEAFSKKQDIHQVTAAEIFQISVDQVTPEQRRRAKTINFGLLYGMSKFGLARQLNIENELAQRYIATYFERYPNIQTYIQTIREIAANQGYVETLLGRRIYLPDIRSAQIMRRRAAERAAINAPMQGTAADLIKIAMIEIDRHILNQKLAMHMVMQVHDELVFEIQEALLPDAIPFIKKAMESALPLIVPLEVAIGVGDNWEEAHSL